ncbi:MAG: hypothetical protein KDD44_04045 [Bdellovibrionales bacterium]|nr:hypothetical protein [Bdellovibrionales bacterium]
MAQVAPPLTQRTLGIDRPKSAIAAAAYPPFRHLDRVCATERSKLPALFTEPYIVASEQLLQTVNADKSSTSIEGMLVRHPRHAVANAAASVMQRFWH